MRKTVIASLLVATGTLPALAVADDAPKDADKTDAAAAPAAAPETPPVSMPAMSATLAGDLKPLKVKAGPLGDVYITGVLSVLGQYETGAIGNGTDDNRWTSDLSNGQVVVQKVDGPYQFFIQGGAYSIPDLGAPYVRSGHATGSLWGGVPQWYLKYAPTDSFSVMAGDLPTLIGAEYTFSFENLNIERGLLWNQENAVNRGIQGNYTIGPVALALSWNDGFFSKHPSWVSGSATYTITPADTLAFVGGGSYKLQTISSFATPLLQNNETIYNLIYTHTQGPFTISPFLQYSTVKADPRLGTTHELKTTGAALYGVYALDGGYSVAGRIEYITANGSTGDPNLLYGPGSKASSITITPTYQDKFFFARLELSYVKATSTTAGLAFGPQGVSTSQTRGLLETGFIF